MVHFIFLPSLKYNSYREKKRERTVQKVTFCDLFLKASLEEKLGYASPPEIHDVFEYNPFLHSPKVYYIQFNK